MTILNVHLTPSRVLFCMDTAVRLHNGTSSTNSKIFFVPHGNVMIGCRGIQDFAFDLFMHAWQQPLSGLDTFVARLTPRIDMLYDKVLGRALVAGSGASEPMTEVVVAGYSEQQGQMAAYRFYKEQPGARYSRQQILELYVAPALVTSDVTQYPDCVQGMVAAAKAQIARWRPSHPDEPLGGCLVCADLNRSTAHFETHPLD